MPYHPDFGEELHSLIKSDYPTQYQDEEVQTSKPVLQSQPTAVVDIPSCISDPTPDLEPAETPPDELNPVLKPIETPEANTAEPTETAVPPTVHETLMDSTPLHDQELPTGSLDDLEQRQPQHYITKTCQSR